MSTGRTRALGSARGGGSDRRPRTGAGDVDALADVDGDAALVEAAVRAHDVGQLGVAAPRTDAARRRVQLPGGGAVAAALRLRLLLLGDGHRSRSFPCEPVDSSG